MSIGQFWGPTLVRRLPIRFDADGCRSPCTIPLIFGSTFFSPGFLLYYSSWIRCYFLLIWGSTLVRRFNQFDLLWTMLPVSLHLHLVQKAEVSPEKYTQRTEGGWQRCLTQASDVSDGGRRRGKFSDNRQIRGLSADGLQRAG